MKDSAVIPMELVDDASEFFAPVSSDVIDGLLGEYQQARGRIDQLAGLMAGDLGNVVHYFIEGNAGNEQMHRSLYVSKLFKKEGAIAALNSACWSKAMRLTDVYDVMPQKRRDEWNNAIKEQTTPEFTAESVRPTIFDLLASRAKFFAERVDGIFRALSHEHVTNCPEGFSKRMILSRVLTEYGTTNCSQVGNINDLRAVIAKFMGRDEPNWNASDSVVKTARARYGEWLALDGGALRIRAYKKGTAHLEVHPDMAWRLNQVLANLYPMAIPPAFRQKPKKQSKTFTMMGRPLPFDVLRLLTGMRVVSERIKPDWPERYREIKNSLRFEYGEHDKAVRAEAERVLYSIGGVLTGKHPYFQFDYDARDVIADIVASGCVPDRKSHQFYPTPASIGAVAIEMASIGDDHTCLEPSAGQGDLAALMPKWRTACVEISALHCDILKARGFHVVHADFLEWADLAKKFKRFDRVVMNPPFSEGRALAHLNAAAELVNQGGRLVAILPASMRGKDLLPGWAHEWSTVYSGEFDGTGVSVAILRADRP